MKRGLFDSQQLLVMLLTGSTNLNGGIMKKLIPVFLVLIVFTTACATAPTEVEQNKTTMEIIAVGFNEGDWDTIRPVIADDFVMHNPFSGDAEGADALIGFFQFMKSVMPDANHPEWTMIAEGDLISIHMPYLGTFENDMGDLPANGAKVNVMMNNVWRFDENGNAVEFWIYMDTMSYMQQLGALP